MMRWWIVGGGIFVGALGALLFGCFVVTGNTDDYKPLPVEAGPCKIAADCNDGGAGPLACCATLDLNAIPPVALACATSCISPSYQSCGGETECHDAGTCSPHTCTFKGATFFVSTCGASICP